MLNAESYKKHVRFIIEHYGTRTEGEEHRFDQVADYLTELELRIQNYTAAIVEVDNQYSDHIAATFQLAIK